MEAAEKHFSKIKKKYLSFLKKQEVLGEPFYNKIAQLKNFYVPISDFIYKTYMSKNSTVIIGLAGGQGSGKTTITQIIKLILKNKFNLNVISLSIDDYYKTLSERKKMSKNIHKLFLTRGVPGTHDVNLLNKTFASVLRKKFKPFFVPKFDKSLDDRCKKSKWEKILKKPDIVIFEGWCVGAKHQDEKDLIKPCNILEKDYDKKLVWRKKVNNDLKNKYNKIFKLINKLIFLEVPSFNYIFKWRLLQEKKLKKTSKGKKTMNEKQVKKFIMFYERISKHMLIELKKIAQIVIRIDKKHRLNNIQFK